MIDDIDKKILEILAENGRESLSEMGKQLGVSHVAVKKRLEKLYAKRIMKVIPAINFEQLGLKGVLILAEVRTSGDIEEIFKKYSKCPRMVFLSTTMGRYNLVAIMVGEDEHTIESILTVCSFRREKGIMKSEVHLINSIFIPKFMPIKIIAEKKGTLTPCGMDCGSCKRYSKNLCLGCPATKVYRGIL